jgi:alpha-galactosidase
MNRRAFLCSSGATALRPLLVAIGGAGSGEAAGETPFEWTTPDLTFAFEFSGQSLRQKSILPADFSGNAIRPPTSSGVETAIQCTGENSPDSGMKQGAGQPGVRLAFVARHEEAASNGRRLVLTHSDPITKIRVESFYQSFSGIPVVRRWTRVTNQSTANVGIDFLSSAMLHALADAQNYEHELIIHVAWNSWMAEGQWHAFRPSELGFVENERTSWSQASAGSVGSWSTEKFLPMAMVENKRLGLTWFWQIEHNGSWYWEISNITFGSNNASDVYAWLGGPDDLHAAAWKNLQPGQSYQSVPVAVGCVRGGFAEAITALTHYRRAACELPRAENTRCPVIFNDYMNCLWADPTEAKELPLIDAAAKAGCEYYVIDAGWYATLHEDWNQTLGNWQPSTDRWPHGLPFVLDRIRQMGMIPGLWIEPEVAGVHSQLALQPDSWFLMRHGKRFLKNSRYLLDFRNPAVSAYLDQVVDRLVHDYGVGYLKMDYNVDSLAGTDQNADSPGQGLLEHNRAHLAWLESILKRYPSLVIENCGSGGGRMDYAMLSRLQIQSATDQENYLRLPAIITGAAAAVLPEQLACWSYPLANSDADQASFNMVTAMLCRIHQSGRIDKIPSRVVVQVKNGIRIYKDVIRKHIPEAAPFYPLGMPDVTNHSQPVALGMRAPGWTALAVWRLEGADTVEIPLQASNAHVLYPDDLGIQVEAKGGKLTTRFPRPRMGCIIVA